MKASILKHPLLRVFGGMGLDAIKMHAIEILRADLLAKELSRKRVNNISTGRVVQRRSPEGPNIPCDRFRVVPACEGLD
jgi:hypothetical protein